MVIVPFRIAHSVCSKDLNYIVRPDGSEADRYPSTRVARRADRETCAAGQAILDTFVIDAENADAATTDKVIEDESRQPTTTSYVWLQIYVKPTDKNSDIYFVLIFALQEKRPPLLGGLLQNSAGWS